MLQLCAHEVAIGAFNKKKIPETAHTCVLPLFAFASIFTTVLISNHPEFMLCPAEASSPLFMLNQPPITHLWVWIRANDERCAIIVLLFVLLVHSSSVHPAQLLIKFCFASPHHLSLHF
jgi:hypothetical protein